MLGFIFGLNARIGRLHYFLSIIGLAIALTGICFLIALAAYHNHPRGTPPSLEVIMWPVIAVGTLFIVVSLTLQSMRFRDMGWDPVCVIPAWIAVAIIDVVIAKKFPAWRSGPIITRPASALSSTSRSCWRCCSGRAPTMKARRRHLANRAGPIPRRVAARVQLRPNVWRAPAASSAAAEFERYLGQHHSLRRRSPRRR